MKTIFDLMEQENFSRSDLDIIARECEKDGGLAPLKAIIFISRSQVPTKGDYESAKHHFGGVGPEAPTRKERNE